MTSLNEKQVNLDELKRLRQNLVKVVEREFPKPLDPGAPQVAVDRIPMKDTAGHIRIRGQTPLILLTGLTSTLGKWRGFSGQTMSQP